MPYAGCPREGLGKKHVVGWVVRVADRQTVLSRVGSAVNVIVGQNPQTGVSIMSARSLKAKGFTLVEILIVVVILGILAAIVIPQFTSASESAKASSLVTQLQSLRSQLELYQLQHNGEYPTVADFWDQMTEETNIAGSTTITTGQKTYGPYLQKEIVNPFTDSSLVVASAAAGVIAEDEGGSVANGFIYDATSGKIRAAIDEDKADDVNLDPADGDVTTY
ncbi:MAG: prepilin-type N-terminal cleavage/methylation domain-containing protein [Planctomycetota bacterium]